MRTLLTFALLALTLTACKSQRGMADLSPEENSELNYYLQKRDECMVQESAQIDDSRSDINAVTDLVMWKCAPIGRKIDSLVYDKFKVDLSSSYAFRMQQEESSRKRVTEAILTNRRIRAGQEGGMELLQQAPVIVPPVRAQAQPPARTMVPEGMAPIPAPTPAPMQQAPQPAQQQMQQPVPQSMPQAAPQGQLGRPVNAREAVKGW